VTGPRHADYRVAIVGGGVIGLYTAYRLARAGAGRIVVLDRGSYLSNGASGRNGGGVRQQWETPETIRLAREAVEAYRRFGTEFGVNPWFRQSGYLFLADSPAEVERLRAVHRTVTREGLPSRWLPVEEVVRLAPGLSTAGILGGSYLSSDGTLYPFPVLWGLFEAVRALGVEVCLAHEVYRISGGDAGRLRVDGVHGRLDADVVVNAAGGWSSEVARRAGVELPTRPVRHEICATEPLKPFLDPMVVRASDGLYFSQTMRGELVGGISVPHTEGLGAGMTTSAGFFTRYARALLGLYPALRELRILRAWSGYYDESPDGLPILGGDPKLPGLVHAAGFGGHGFMLAPSVSRLVAAAALGEHPPELAPFAPTRFADPSAPLRSREKLSLG
jgi:sarcosine oxidase subunit beta